MKAQVVRIWDDGERTCVSVQGRKNTYAIGFGTPIRVRKLTEANGKPKPLYEGKKAYPLAKAIAHIRRAAETHGITEAATKLLARIEAGDIKVAEVDDLPDETNAPVAPAAKVRRSALAGDKVEKTPRGNVLAGILAELKLEGRVARRKLRKAGLHAPYTDAAAIRKALA